MQEVHDFLKKCNTYYLATTEGGQPRVRPFGTVDIYDGKLYIQTAKSKNVAQQIMADPRIEICAFDSGRWVRVSATATEDPRLEPQVHMLDSYPNLKERYAPNDGNNVVFALSNVTATFYSFSEKPRTVTF